MNSGPQISSNVGRLDRLHVSQNSPCHRPNPVHSARPRLDFLFIDFPSGVSLNGPSCSINVANVTSLAPARGFPPSAQRLFSIADSVEIIFPPDLKSDQNGNRINLFTSLPPVFQLQ